MAGLEDCSAGRAVSGGGRQGLQEVPLVLLQREQEDWQKGTEDALRKPKIYRRKRERSRKQ